MLVDTDVCVPARPGRQATGAAALHALRCQVPTGGWMRTPGRTHVWRLGPSGLRIGMVLGMGYVAAVPTHKAHFHSSGPVARPTAAACLACGRATQTAGRTSFPRTMAPPATCAMVSGPRALGTPWAAPCSWPLQCGRGGQARIRAGAAHTPTWCTCACRGSQCRHAQGRRRALMVRPASAREVLLQALDVPQLERHPGWCERALCAAVCARGQYQLLRCPLRSP